MFSEKLRQAIRDSGQTTYAIAKATNMGASNLAKFVSGEKEVGFETGMRLLAHLCITLDGVGPNPLPENPSQEDPSVTERAAENPSRDLAIHRTQPCQRCVELEKRIQDLTITTPALPNPSKRPVNLQDRESFKPRRSPREQARVDAWRKP